MYKRQELSRLNILLSPPDINQSDPYFARKNSSILYALGAIKNVGIDSMKELVRERKKNGPFKDFNDFINRSDNSIINKKTLEALACAGAFDQFKIHRSVIFNQASDIVKFHKSFNESSATNQGDMFGSETLPVIQLTSESEWDTSYKLMKEYEMLGFYLSGHPLEQYKANFDKLFIKSFSDIKSNSKYHDQKDILLSGTLLTKKEKRSARGNSYAFLNFSDLTSIFELIIFESNLRKYRDILNEGESFIVGVDFSTQNGTLRGELKKVFKFDDLDRIDTKNFAADVKQVTSAQQTVSIYTDGNFSKDELSKLKWIRGKSNVQIIINNQLLKIPGQFEISSEMISKMKNLNGCLLYTSPSPRD